MENYLRLVLFKYLIYTVIITNRSNKCNEIEVAAVFHDKLLLYLIGIVFVYINDYYLLWVIFSDLTHKLGTDASAAACYHTYLAVDEVLDILVVEFDRIASEKLFYLYIVYLSEQCCRIIKDKSTDKGNDLQR